MRSELFLELEVELLEDLHSGTGTGAGAIDRVQARDRWGSPVIWATHFKGLLRAAAEELAALGVLSAGDEKVRQQALLERLFGAEGRREGRGLDLHSLYLDAVDRVAPMVVWASSARELGGRRPRDDTLRQVEFVPAGTRFRGKILLRDSALLEDVRKILGHVDRVGAQRNRGGGLVQIGVCEAALGGAGAVSLTEVSDRLRLLLRSLDPLCLPTTGFPGNTIRSESFIRGQQLRGALIRWGMERHAAEACEVEACKALFFAQREGCWGVEVGNGYVVPAAAVAAGWADLATWQVLPVALNLLSRKPTSQSVDRPWWAVAHPPEPQRFDCFEGSEDEAGQGEKPKRPKDRELLFRRASGGWEGVTPDLGIQLRNQVVEVADGGRRSELFSEEAIAEQSLFLVDLYFAGEEEARDFARIFAALLRGESWLGLGRGARPVEVVGACWLPEDAVYAGEDADPEELVVTLTSELIARDERLRYVNTLTPELLWRLSGGGKGQVARDWQWVSKGEAVTVRGFNAATGLPRAPAVALRRGSSIMVSGGPVSALRERLRRCRALGERCEEGFGRFCLGVITPPEGGATRVAPTLPQNREEALLQRAQAFVKQVQAARGRGAETQDAGEKTPVPSLSQWHWLRMRALAQPTCEALQRFFTRELEERAATKAGAVWSASLRDELCAAVAECADLAEARELINLLLRLLKVEAERNGGEG